MESGAAARVGLMSLIGMGLFVAAWWFLSHGLYDLTHFRLKVPFENTNGLLRQSPVRMNGVTIGEVEDIRLDDPAHPLMPVVTLAIERRYEGRIPADSTIAITSGLLISNPQIDITPGTGPARMASGAWWPKDQVRAPAGLLAQVSPEADKALRQFTETMQELTPRLGRVMVRVEGILNRANGVMANLEGATGEARSLLADPKIRRTLHAALTDLETMSADLRRTSLTLTADLRGMVRRNGPKLDELATGAVELLVNVRDTIDAARSMVTRLSEQVSDPRLQQSLQETLDLAKATVARFNQIASDIHQISGDPEIQKSLKTTLGTLGETSDRANEALERVNSLLGSIRIPTGSPRLGIGRPEVGIDFLGRANAPYFRSDVGIRLPIGDRNAVRLGLYEFGEQYKLNAQYETRVMDTAALRYGIYASKLGIGYDWRISPGARLVLDAYDPNNLQFDARALYRLSDDFSLWLGADSVFRNTTPVLGIRLTR